MVKCKFLAQFPVDHLAHPVVSSHTLSVLVCCIHLLCDWSFHLYHHITYICYFVVSYLFFLWYSWSLCWYFEVLLEEITFLSNGIPFLATSKFSCVRCCLKCQVSCFSSHFCFRLIFALLILVVSVLFMVAVISFFSAFFLCIRHVVVSMHQLYRQCWQVLFLFFLAHIVCRCHIWDVRPYVWSLVFLFSGSFV